MVTRPIRMGRQTVGLFAGIPEADRELASALLSLAGVAILWSRRG
ncbi:MAG: hypothetical protein ACKOWF_00210 [Chloroflexota bacterium]